MSKTGFFITFEGGEGSGKTTQINRLSDFLNVENERLITTREPGGTEEAEKIRGLLVKRDGGNWSPESEVLLLYAARSLHVERIIQPSLNKDKIVICDRFSDSTMAYQGYGHGYDIEKIKALDTLVFGDLKPDLTIILDIPAKQGIERSTRRLAGEMSGIDREEDRYEQMDITFHERLRQGFLEIAKDNPDRCHVIDATQPLDAVTDAIKALVSEKLPA